MIGNLTGLHLIIILGIVLLLFGATRLPALAKGVGQSLRIFRSEIQTTEDTHPVKPDDAPDQSTSSH